ncbi:MAG: universal stress protein [Verrucomicrobiota bacterium]
MPAPKKTAPAKSAPRASAKIVVSGKGGRGHATVPVTQDLAPLRFHIRKILVPVDFSENGQKSIHYARAFAEQFEATLVLIHAIEPLAYPPDFAFVPLLPPDVEEKRAEELQKQLDNLARNLGGGVPVETVLRSGRPWQEIVDYARTAGIDLLVVTTHGYTGLKHALLGSVAEKIVRHAPCPVLVVRTEEHDFA